MDNRRKIENELPEDFMIHENEFDKDDEGEWWKSVAYPMIVMVLSFSCLIGLATIVTAIFDSIRSMFM